MRLFTLGRAARLAMLGGAIYYVRKNGGLKATWDKISEKVKPLLDKKNAETASSTQFTPSSETMRKSNEPIEAQYPGSVGSSSYPDYGSDKGNKSGY